MSSSPATSRKGVVVAAIVIALVLFVGIFVKKFWPMISGKGFGGFQQPPATVSAVLAQTRDWQPTLRAVATLEPVNGVDIATEVAGVVSKVDFRSGAKAKKGALLIQIDDSSDRAELAGLEADLVLAKNNLERTESLIERSLASREGLDSAKAALQRAEAAVGSKRALIAKKAIRAPFDGTLGIRNVNVGEYVVAGKLLVGLQDLEQLYADFSVPQQQIRSLAAGQPVRVTIDAYPGKSFDGRITAVDSQIDDTTHTLRAQATIANAEHLLRPGMYAVVEAELPLLKGVVVVPKTAITYSLYGDSVFVVREAKGDDGKPQLDAEGKPMTKAFRAPVKLGFEHDQEVVVATGVAAGELVITAGQLKLQDGMPVAVVAPSAPAAAPAAAPATQK
jgi:RND family efflux transporter MFP subunit